MVFHGGGNFGDLYEGEHGLKLHVMTVGFVPDIWRRYIGRSVGVVAPCRAASELAPKQMEPPTPERAGADLTLLPDDHRTSHPSAPTSSPNHSSSAPPTRSPPPTRSSPPSLTPQTPSPSETFNRAISPSNTLPFPTSASTSRPISSSTWASDQNCAPNSPRPSRMICSSSGARTWRGPVGIGRAGRVQKISRDLLSSGWERCRGREEG